MTRALVPASREVIEHHADEHRHVPGWKGKPRHDAVCPCGSVVALLCDGCGFPLYLAVNPDRPVCKHAREGFRVGPPAARDWPREPRDGLFERLTGEGP